MRRSISSFFRFAVCFLVVSILTSGIAMAAYVCPQTVMSMENMEMPMNGEPCMGMDKQKPVQCAEYQSGGQLALEHLAAPPALTPILASFVIPAPVPTAQPIAVFAWDEFPFAAGADPPYLRTQRLRI